MLEERVLLILSKSPEKPIRPSKKKHFLETKFTPFLWANNHIGVRKIKPEDHAKNVTGNESTRPAARFLHSLLLHLWSETN